MASQRKTIVQDLCFLVLILVFAAYSQIHRSGGNDGADGLAAEPASESIVLK